MCSKLQLQQGPEQAGAGRSAFTLNNSGTKGVSKLSLGRFSISRKSKELR
jgi:hypothetical protein